MPDSHRSVLVRLIESTARPGCSLPICLRDRNVTGADVFPAPSAPRLTTRCTRGESIDATAFGTLRSATASACAHSTAAEYIVFSVNAVVALLLPAPTTYLNL